MALADELDIKHKKTTNQEKTEAEQLHDFTMTVQISSSAYCMYTQRQ